MNNSSKSGKMFTSISFYFTLENRHNKATIPLLEEDIRTFLFLLALAAHLNKGDIPDEIEITRKGKEHDPPLKFY